MIYYSTSLKPSYFRGILSSDNLLENSTARFTCQKNTDCSPNQICVEKPDGYCGKFECTSDDDCPGGNDTFCSDEECWQNEEGDAVITFKKTLLFLHSFIKERLLRP